MFIAFILPVMFYFKTFKMEEIPNYERWLCYFILFYGGVGGMIATLYALVYLF
jgi:NhaP-type Na+/H+ or K+/H+ antiporter